MSTQLSKIDRYPASPDKLIAMMRSRDYFEAKYAHLEDIKFEVTKFEPSGDGVAVEVDREVAADMPDFAKKILGETNHLVQHETWSKDGAGYSCELIIDSPGKPITMKGSMSIVAAGEGESDWALDLDIHSSLPLVGRKIEKIAHDQTRSASDKEMEFNLGWLASL
ncbi:MAG: DUF2505 domain-containing protein [Candidatus Nanopelagicales bacterium]|nr:DUF2505 domain-containing protein [Candidatus Nanopelagicales bacterium]MDZ4250245.1 DUF2505 domain-containing protein [Candidatus Nanopelagicales bacterium]